MTQNISPRGIRFSDPGAELAEFELKQGLMNWVVKNARTLKGMMAYSNLVCAAGDSLFGVGEVNMVDYVNHVAGFYDSRAWDKVEMAVLGDYLVAVPAGVSATTVEVDVAQAATGVSVPYSLADRKRSQCPVCLWKSGVKDHCPVCWSVAGDLRLGLMSVDFPFYIQDELATVVKTLGLGHVIRSVDGVLRWWVRLDVAAYFVVHHGGSLERGVAYLGSRRDGLFQAAVRLFDSRQVVLTSSPSTSALVKLVEYEGERVGPLVFAMALAQHMGVMGVEALSQEFGSVFSSEDEAEVKLKMPMTAKLESLSLLAQLELTGGTSTSAARLPSRFHKVLTVGAFVSMTLDRVSDYMDSLGYKLVANIRELSVTHVARSARLSEVKATRKSTQGMSLAHIRSSLRLDTEYLRASSPLSDVSVSSTSSQPSAVSSTTTLASAGLFADGASHGLSVAPYQTPSVESDVGSGVKHTVEGYAMEEGSGDVQGFELVELQPLDDALYDIVKDIVVPVDTPRCVTEVPWFSREHRHGDNAMMMLGAMPTLAMVTESGTNTAVGYAAAAEFKSRLAPLVERAERYAMMGFSVDVVVRTDVPTVGELHFGGNVYVVLLVQAPSVDPLTRGSLEVAREVYRPATHVFTCLPDLAMADPRYLSVFQIGWLVCRLQPDVMLTKLSHKVRTINMVQFLNDGQMQQHLDVPEMIIGAMLTSLESGKTWMTGTLLVLYLNLYSDKSYRLVWPGMSDNFDEYTIDMVTRMEIDTSGVQVHVHYACGDYQIVVNDVEVVSEKASDVVRASYGLNKALGKGDGVFEGFVRSLEAKAGFKVFRRRAMSDDDANSDFEQDTLVGSEV